MNLFRLLLLLFLEVYVHGVEFRIVCRKNCDNGSQIDVKQEIEIVGECIEDCSSSLKYLWELESSPKNLRQTLEPNDTLGSNTSFLTILPNVLYCGEVYDLALSITHSTGIKIYVVEISMQKCSRKYPAGEEMDETQFENDYSDFDYVDVSEEDLELSQDKLWKKINDAITAMKLMYNKSESFSGPKKRVEIIKLIELTETKSEHKYYKAINETVMLGVYGPKYVPSVVKKALQVGLTLCNRIVELLGRSPSFEAYRKFFVHAEHLITISTRAYLTRSDEITDHRPKPTPLPGYDMDPQEDIANYPDYNDFDLTHRKRKAIIDEIRMLQLQIFKVNALLKVRANVSNHLDEFFMSFGMITCYKRKIPSEMRHVYVRAKLPVGVHDELRTLFNNDTGLIFITLYASLFWKQRPTKRYVTNYLALGSGFDPFALKNVTNSFEWIVKYIFHKFDLASGYFRLPSYREYEQITDEYLSIHELFVDLPMEAMSIKIEGLRNYETIKAVILSECRPKMKDILGNDTYIVSGEVPATFIPVRASPGSKLYLGLMPTKELLQDPKEWDKFQNYKYNVLLARLQCEHINEYTHKRDSKICNISSWDEYDGIYFHCSCRKLGLYQFSQIQIRSRFLKRGPVVFTGPPLNFVPCISLGVVVSIYFLAMFSKLVNKRSHVIVKRVKHLMDNNLSHRFEYILVVTTRSSTTANIAFQLHGSEASTPPHLFRGQSEPVLQSKADDWFYLLTEEELGNLQSIDLWSDCYGFKSSWFCSKIKVINRKTNQEWIFQVNDWISPIGKKTFKTINIENPEEIYYFPRHVYALKGIANHLWVKTFTRLQTPIFTFNERIHVLLSIFTLNMMFTMCLLKFSHDNLDFWHFGYTTYNFGTFEILTGCLSGFCTFVFTVFLIYFFSNSGNFSSSTSTENLRHSPCWRIISWILMMFGLIGSCAVVAYFGVFTGFRTSIVWLYTFFLGVVVCIILECFRAMIAGCITRNIESKILTIDYKSIEIQRKKITKELGQGGMRFLLQKFYSKLSEEEIKEKEKNAQEIKVLRFEKSEFIAYIIYIMILFIIILYDRDPLCYISANNIRDIFIDDKYLRKIELSEINSQKRFYRYMQQVFLPAIHTTNWYGSYGSSAPGRLIDFNSKMIGTARIRQIRIQNGTCKVPERLRHFVNECHGEYSWYAQDTENYGEFWGTYNASAIKFDSDESWFYKEWSEAKALPFVGELAVYPGGGYIMKFGRTWSNSRIILRYIKNTRWIDERTRAIFLDVNFYSVNDNLFNFLTIAIEQSATGAFITNYQLNTLRFLFHGDIISRILPFLWSSLSIFLVIFSWNKYYQYKEFHSSSCRQLLIDFWNLIDFLIILLIFCMLVNLGIRSFVIENILSSMKLSNKNDFISYYDIILCQKAIEVTTAILITFSTIRLWKLLRFLRQFQLFELTLAFSAKYLLSMMIINVILIFVYAGVGFLILGPYVREFRTIWSSFVALMLISFGLEFNLGLDSNHQTMYSYLGYIYFTGYLILVLVLLNIFVTIIVVGYKNSKEYLDQQTPQRKYNILAFLRDEWAYNRSKYKGRIRNITIMNETNRALKEFRLRAGQDPLVPKLSTANSNKVVHNAQSMFEMHQLADKATTLIQEKYRYNADQRHEQALKVLGHYYHRFSDEKQPKTTVYDEYLVAMDENKESVYCSVKRQNDIKCIVEYLLNRKEPKTPESIEDTKKLIERQMNDVINMRKTSEQLIETLEKLLREGCKTKSTQVTYQDLGIEFSEASSSAESSDNIEIDFEDGNITVVLNV